MQPYVRAGVLEHFRATMLALGANPDHALRKANIPADMLEITGSYIPHENYRHLLHYAAEATNCPHFVIEMTKQTGIGSLGLTGLLMMQAADVGKAWTTFSRVFTTQDTFGKLKVQRGPQSASISYALPHYDTAGCRQASDMALVIPINILRQLCGPTWQPTVIGLPYPKPADLSIYDFLKADKLVFNHHAHETFFDNKWLDHKIETSQPEMRRILDMYFAPIVTGKYCNATDQTDRIIRELLASGNCNIEQTAALMSISVRGLQARLHSEQCSFQQLLDAARKDIAIHHMRGADMSLTTLAMILGYSELSAFSRAFKRWFGLSPNQWVKHKLFIE